MLRVSVEQPGALRTQRQHVVSPCQALSDGDTWIPRLWESMGPRRTWVGSQWGGGWGWGETPHSPARVPRADPTAWREQCQGSDGGGRGECRPGQPPSTADSARAPSAHVVTLLCLLWPPYSFRFEQGGTWESGTRSSLQRRRCSRQNRRRRVPRRGGGRSKPHVKCSH